ncbi:hypothetical protein C8Q80DRAFT_1122781 [Daedaleopsis nitida]|nr:hypothetical protein C8Q80DRAFT_1122781 [Daedaleopsis nitida]
MIPLANSRSLSALISSSPRIASCTFKPFVLRVSSRSWMQFKLMDAVQAGSSCRKLSRMQFCASAGHLEPSIQLADDQGYQTMQIDLPHGYYNLAHRWERDRIRQMWFSELFRGVKTLRTIALPFLYLLVRPYNFYLALSNLESLAIHTPHRKLIPRLTTLIPAGSADPVKFPKLATLCLPMIALSDLPSLYAIVESRQTAGHPSIDQLYALTQLHGLLADRFVVTWIDEDKHKDEDARGHFLPRDLEWAYPADCTRAVIGTRGSSGQRGLGNQSLHSRNAANIVNI